MSAIPNLIVVASAIAGQPCASSNARPYSVCSSIGDADLASLAAAALPKTIQAGASFMAEGEPASHFFSLTDGTARVFKLLPDGRRQVTGFARAGHFLGLASADLYTVSAEAIGLVQLCRFSRLQLHGLMTKFPRLERQLRQTAANELATAQEQMVLLGRKTARERVASFLVGWAAGAGPSATPVKDLCLPMPRGDIADYLGLTVETVSRTLTRFRIEGLLAIPTPCEVEVLRPAILADIAQGTV